MYDTSRSTKYSIYTIEKCNDLTEVANQIAKQYGQQRNVHSLVMNTLNGIINIKRETGRQYIDSQTYERLVQRHIPKTGNKCSIYNAMVELKHRTDQSNTQIFPQNKQIIGSGTKVFDKTKNTGTDTRVFDPEEYNSSDTNVYNN